MFIVTLRTRLEALRTTCARRARQPGTERAPAAAPASQPPPAPPRNLSAELKPTLGPITDASSGAKGDRVLSGDGWGRGGRGRQGGAEQRAAGGGGSQCHQVGEAAPKNRAVKRWVGVKTPDRAADGVGDTDETATRQATASPPRAEQPPEGAGWPPCTPGDEGGRREASAPPDGGAGGHADHLPVHTGFLQPGCAKSAGCNSHERCRAATHLGPPLAPVTESRSPPTIRHEQAPGELGGGAISRRVPAEASDATDELQRTSAKRVRVESSRAAEGGGRAHVMG